MTKKLLPMLLCDFYKISHKKLYDTESGILYSTWTPRKSRIEGVDKVVTFGLQGFIKEYLIDYFNENFFNKPLDEVISEYVRVISNTLNDPNPETDHIEALHKLGYLPIKICSIPEGTLCPIRVPMFTIENTLPEFYWITNFLETIMSTYIWKPSTSATIAYQYYKIVNKWADKTCDNKDHIPFCCHDFSMRGMACLGSAETSGAGHLLSFAGTDTIPAILYLENYYNADCTKELVGTSIPATEHSIMELNSYGKENDEYDAFKRIITEVHPNGFVSIVSDTWNLWKVLTDTCVRLKTEIMSRDGRVVIRPDSGDPCDIICGLNTSDYRLSNGTDGKLCTIENDDNVGKILVPIENQEYADERYKGVIELLWEVFGGTINSKGYKVLDPHIGCIYGDAITLERAEEICKRLESKGFASSNIVFGIGSYCISKDTKILCSDFIWRRAEDIEVGQEIFCFNEDPIYGNGAMSSRKYKLGKITYNEKGKKKGLTICCGKRKLTCSKDHPVLVWGSQYGNTAFFNKPNEEQLKSFNVDIPRGYGLIWKKAEELKIGDKLAFLQDPWECCNDYDTGYISAMFDAEGSLSRWSKSNSVFSSLVITFTQKEGIVLNEVKRLLQKHNFRWYENIKDNNVCGIRILGGFLEVIRFLGTFRPKRLLDKAYKELYNLPVLKRNSSYSLQEVTNISEEFIIDIANISTSEGTFITDGFLTHNTYNMNTRDTFGFALKTTYAQVNGKELLLYKDPITDDGTKKSQKGMVSVFRDEMFDEIMYRDEYYQKDKEEAIQMRKDHPNDEHYEMLQTVFLNGKLLKDWSLSEIRNRLKEEMNCERRLVCK